MSESNHVKVSILGQDYTINCPPDSKATLLQAADLLHQQMHSIHNTGRIHGLERIAIMAALNISAELVEARQESQTVETVCHQLNQRISAVLETD